MDPVVLILLSVPGSGSLYDSEFELQLELVVPVPRFLTSVVLVPGSLVRLQELLLNYNRLQRLPEELSGCESLERLELAGNHDLDQLPDQVDTKPW